METSLHHHLKQLYAEPGGALEVTVAGFRIDVVRDNVLIEIQHASLGKIWQKTRKLLQGEHTVHVVKPIVMRKKLVKLSRRDGKIRETRLSPKRGRLLDIFSELIYFTQVFPHPNLILEVLLVDVEELRYPRRASTRRWRQRDYHVQDQRLVRVGDRVALKTRADLLQFLPQAISEPFDTRALGEILQIPRWQAQQITYCCRQCGALESVGKAGNSRLYQRSAGLDEPVATKGKNSRAWRATRAARD